MRTVAAFVIALIALGAHVCAHCDGLDGPVVEAARKALETGEVNLVLIWVQKPDQAEIKRAFDHAQAVRKLSAEPARSRTDISLRRSSASIAQARARRSQV
jgi:Family of unknown function (DUF6448)